jgi:hypothetical protein
MSLADDTHVLNETTELFLETLFPELENLSIEFVKAKWGIPAALYVHTYDTITEKKDLTPIPYRCIRDWLHNPTGATALDLVVNNSDIIPNLSLNDALEDLLCEQMELKFTHPYDLAIDPLSSFIIEYENTRN